MGFLDGFNGGLASFQYLQDQADHRREVKRQDEGDYMRREAFGVEQKRAQAKQISQMARYLAGLSPQSRAVAYNSMRPTLDPLAQSLGLPPAPDVWSEDHLGELQQLAQMDMDGSGMPAGIQEFNALTNGLSDEDRLKAQRVKLGLDGRAPSGLPFGFMEVVGSDGVTRIIQTNKAEGGAAEIGPGGVPQGFGAGPAPQTAPPPSGDLASVLNLSARHRFQLTSFGRSPEENASLPGAAKHSNHLTEDALDYSISGKSPQQIQSFVADMANAGWIGKIHTKGTAPHLHFDRAGANPYASRPAEQQAALNTGAQEQAKVDVAVSNTDRVAQSEAEIAAAKAKAEASGKAAGERDATQAQKVVNAEDSLNLLEEVIKILPAATGSFAGAGRDAAGRLIGVSTEGAQAAARLKVLGGMLTAKVPRMEGPQSNYDVASYKEQAGNLADPTLPVATRIAAAREMIRLNQKYAHLNRANAPAAAPAKRLKYNPATGKLE